MDFRFLEPYRPQLLSVLRIIIGLMLFQYGVAKILKFPPDSPFAKVELFSLYGAAGSLELILGGLLIIGLFSRLVAFILAGERARVPGASTPRAARLDLSSRRDMIAIMS